MTVKRDREIRVPFRIGPDGGIDFTIDPVIRAAQHLVTLIGTHRPERVMRPSYGTSVQGALFDSDDPVDQTEMVSDIQDAARTWAPDLEIVSIEPRSASSSDGLVEYAVAFRLRGTRDINVVTIEQGGEVDRVI